MKIEKIGYEQLFPLPQPFANVRLSMEIQLTKGDTIEDSFAKAKTIAEESFKKMFPQAAQPVTDFNTGEQKSLPSAAQAKAEADKEFDDFKKQVDTFKTKEQAEKFLSISPFKMSIEAKKYIQNKFNNNVEKQQTKQ